MQDYFFIAWTVLLKSMGDAWTNRLNEHISRVVFDEDMLYKMKEHSSESRLINEFFPNGRICLFAVGPQIVSKHDR